MSAWRGTQDFMNKKTVVSRRRTIWAVRDRQGAKWFSECPTFASGFDIFNGDQIQEPKDKRQYRIVRKFKVRVTGQMVGRYGCKSVMQVG